MTARFLSVLALLAIPVAAGAHVQGAESMTFLGGFLHSLSGADHVLAALAVGCIARWSADRTRWTLPLTFVGAMGISIMIFGGTPATAMTELLIAVSVVALGVLVALGAPASTYPMIALVGLFGWFHGQAHGEVLSNGAAPTYATGVIIGTALLHFAGFVLAVLLTRDRPHAVLRAAGAGMAVTGGVWVFAGA